jgi:tRNA (mo5U34)-methyltransferase
MDLTVEQVLSECPEWFHSIQLSPTVVTPGRAAPEALKRQLQSLRLPDLHGKSVLDVGAYDGYYSFAAERLGAARVVALDHYVWSADMAAYTRDWRESNRTGEPLPSPHESVHWRPDELPGRKPFDLARKILGSKVEPVVGDFMTTDAKSLGQFDVVFFLGVLYHLEDLLVAMKKLRNFTAPGGLLVVETEAMEVLGSGRRALCEFFPGQELNNDASNWWSPNAAALEGLCRAAGFSEAKVYKSWDRSYTYGFPKNIAQSAVVWMKEIFKAGFGFPVRRYRAIAHARAGSAN